MCFLPRIKDSLWTKARFERRSMWITLWILRVTERDNRDGRDGLAAVGARRMLWKPSLGRMRSGAESGAH